MSRTLPLTHFDNQGQARMVGVADKGVTLRTAKATGCITMQADTLALVRAGHPKKGDVLGVARVAAIQAAKRTDELIPLCHPLALTRIEVAFDLEENPSRVWCTVTVEAWERTGVEMEALTAVQIGLLTIYDMCKAVERGMIIEGVHLLEKHGGSSGDFVADTAQS